MEILLKIQALLKISVLKHIIATYYVMLNFFLQGDLGSGGHMSGVTID